MAGFSQWRFQLTANSAAPDALVEQPTPVHPDIPEGGRLVVLQEKNRKFRHVTLDARVIEHLKAEDSLAVDFEVPGVQQAGGVWFPDSAYKTAQALRDFNREDLPCIVFANWRGFSGGQCGLGIQRRHTPGARDRLASRCGHGMRQGQGCRFR